MVSSLRAAFPIVAAALGDRLGVQVLVQGQTAKTDGQTIIIPAYDGSDTTYRDMAWGFLAHEAGHLRYTDFAQFKAAATSPLRRAILNIVEDVRIEKALAHDYPGTRRSIELTIAYLMAEGTLGLPSMNAHPGAILQAALLFRLRTDILGQHQLKTLGEMAMLQLEALLDHNIVNAIHAHLSRVSNLSSTEAALIWTDDLLALIEVEEVGMDSNSGDEGIQRPGHLGDQNALQPPDTPGSPVPSPPLASRNLQRFINVAEGDLMEDLIDHVRETLTLAPSQSTGITLPIGEDPPKHRGQGEQRLEKARRTSVLLRSSLEGLVQSSRRTLRVPVRQGQRIFAQRLSGALMPSARVFQKTTRHRSLDTAIEILIDRSPSMSAAVSLGGEWVGSRADLAWDATLALILALEGITGVNAGVTAFPGRDGDATSVYRILPHGDRIRMRIDAFGGDLDGSTPLAEAIWYGAHQVLKQREPRKIILVLTDGIPDDPDQARAIIHRCREEGIDVLGLGLAIDVSGVFDQCVTIHHLEDLRQQLFELCSILLTSRRKEVR